MLSDFHSDSKLGLPFEVPSALVCFPPFHGSIRNSTHRFVDSIGANSQPLLSEPVRVALFLYRALRGVDLRLSASQGSRLKYSAVAIFVSKDRLRTKHGIEKRTDRNSDKDKVLEQTKLSSWAFAHDERCKEESADSQKSLKGYELSVSRLWRRPSRVTGGVARDNDRGLFLN